MAKISQLTPAAGQAGAAQPDMVDLMDTLDNRVADILEGVALLKNIRVDHECWLEDGTSPPVDWTIDRIFELSKSARDACVPVRKALWSAPEAKTAAGETASPSVDVRARKVDDGYIVAMAEEWDVAHSALKAAPLGTGNLKAAQDRLSAIEGRLLRTGPVSREGIEAILHVAAAISTERESDRDAWTGDGPAGALICRALDGLGYLKNPDLT